MAELNIIEGPMKGQTFPLEGETVFVGRSLKNDVYIKDDAISRKQIKIFRISEKVFVEDLKSTNGTFINGEMITPGEGFEVWEGDIISIGHSVLKLAGIPKKKPLDSKNLSVQPAEKDKEKDDQLMKERRSSKSKNMELIGKVSELFKDSLGLNDFFEKVLELLMDSLPRIDTTAILLFNQAERKISDIISRSRHEPGGKAVHYSKKVVKKVINERKMIRMSDTRYEAKEEYSEGDDTAEIGSILCVPMISNSEVRGAIYIDSIRGPYGFRKEDMALLRSLSGPLAVAVEKATLISNLEKTRVP
jgi:pSer/pThr/pTyr-binding forkhead associated (FHA) protein